MELLAEFQTHAMHQCRDVCVRQDQVIRLIRQCQLKANECVMDLNKKADRMKKIASDLRDVDRLARYVDQSRLAVDSIVEQLQTLEHLLPSSVIKNIQTPLFNMEKILSTPRMSTTAADSTGKESLSSSTLVTPRMDGDGMSSPYALSITSDLGHPDTEDKQPTVTDDNVTEAEAAAEVEEESEDADGVAENADAKEFPDPMHVASASSILAKSADPDPVMPPVEEENSAAPDEDADG